MAWMLDEILKELVLALLLWLGGKAMTAAGLNENCMITGCRNRGTRRGLCLLCYSRAKKKIDTGETTWEKLIERGLAKDDRDPFDTAYEKAMKEDE